MAEKTGIPETPTPVTLQASLALGGPQDINGLPCFQWLNAQSRLGAVVIVSGCVAETWPWRTP